MFLSDMREDAYHFICKKYSYARCKLMNRLLSFKTIWLPLIYIFYFGVKMPKVIYRIIFFLMNTFRSHNKLFLYILNTQKEWKTTSFYYILYTRAKPPNANPLNEYSVKTTQCGNMVGTKPPGLYGTQYLTNVISVLYLIIIMMVVHNDISMISIM